MAKVQIEMTGDEAKAWRALAKLEEKNRALTDELRNTRRAAKDAGSTLEDAGGRGSRVAENLASTFKVGVTGGIASAVAAMAEFNAMADAAANRINAVAVSTRTLFQLSGGADLKSIAEQLRTRHGIPEQEAANLAFRASSAGPKFLGDIHTLARLRDIGIDPLAMIAGQQKVEGAFAGVDWSTRAFSDKLLAAAGPANVEAGALAAALSTAAVSAAGVGFKPEQLLAMGSRFSDIFKSPEAGAERIKSLTEALDKRLDEIVAPFSLVQGGVGPMRPGELPGGAMGPFATMTGLDLALNLRQLAERGQLVRGGRALSAEEFLQESNAVQGFRAAESNRAVILDRLGQIGRSEGLTAARLLEAEGIPSLSAEKALRVATERRELLEERDLGTKRNLLSAVNQERYARMRQDGYPEFFLPIARKFDAVLEWATGPDFWLNAPSNRSLSPELQGAIQQTVRSPGRGGAGAVESVVGGEAARWHGAAAAMERAAASIERASSRLNAPVAGIRTGDDR